MYSLAPNPDCQEYLDSAYNKFQKSYLFGLHKVHDAHNSFFAFVAWEVIGMLLIVWHRQLLCSKGLWHKNEERLGDPFFTEQEKNRWNDKLQYLSIEEKRRNEIGQPMTKSEKREFLVGDYFSMENFLGTVPHEAKSYFYNVVPRDELHINEVKPGKDLYIWMFLVELLSAFYILVNYTKMASTSHGSVASSLTTNLFSGSMVLTLFIQLGFIIVDRIIFLYRSLTAKLFLLYITVCYWFVLMFFLWPVSSQTGFVDNAHTKFFFFLKCIYFILSGVQIHHGFLPVEVTSFGLSNQASIMRGYVYRLYRAIPFVFELKTLLDWMCIKSSLDLWESFKMEDIYAVLFIVQCDIIYRRRHPRGAPQPLFRKIFNGFALFLVLILVILGPLLLFSSANPVTTSNNVQSAQIRIDLIGTSGEYRLATISSIYSSDQVSDYEYLKMKRMRMIDENDKAADIQQINLVHYSDDLWSITPPSLEQLITSLNDPDEGAMKARFGYSFRRNGPVSFKSISGQVTVDLPLESQQPLAVALNATTDTDRVTIPALIPSYFRLPATSDPINISPDQKSDALLVLTNDPASPNNQWWEVRLSNESYSYLTYKTDNIAFFTVSNPIWENPLFGNGYGYSIIPMYSLIVLTVGQFARLAFSNQVQKILYEDLQDVDDLVKFCEGIYIARRNEDLDKEETLFRRLLKIYRTPSLLIALTRRKHDDDEGDDDDDVDQGDSGDDSSGDSSSGDYTSGYDSTTGVRKRRKRIPVAQDPWGIHD